jgi:hypothetical protein
VCHPAFSRVGSTRSPMSDWDVHAEDMVAGFSETHAGNESHIAGSENNDAHELQVEGVNPSRRLLKYPRKPRVSSLGQISVKRRRSIP